MLALSSHKKGRRDAGLGRFHRLPQDDTAMDCERARRFTAARAAQSVIAECNPTFRDIARQVVGARAMEETVYFSSAGGDGPGGPALGAGGIQKPMLGRYQVEKELGKGAMGIVYLGRDPKIDRAVAIKTMALAQQFEPDELDDVKRRFFREAETAGRLNHPHIVTIYDAGEEHDLAYIAMEFLHGTDLAAYTRKDSLLPLPTVIDIVSRAADALDYAHSKNVVHRDVKPANIMYEPETGAVKLTDFGIARITDSSKTKTGMVLGTPSYMSPEQLAGRKVDGRSDLFSLGAMLYQLVTGSLPFQAESMTSLLFKIANEPPPDPLSLRASLPPRLCSIIDKALQKSDARRYQRGAELARDLRRCAQQSLGA